jgi:hypothetical protein
MTTKKTITTRNLTWTKTQAGDWLAKGHYCLLVIQEKNQSAHYLLYQTKGRTNDCFGELIADVTRPEDGFEQAELHLSANK